jgi:uncharacterized protein
MSVTLESVLAGLDEAAVAVSGGVDSLTLASLASRILGARVTMVHARSAAVPPEATARVEALADRQGWRLVLVDAGEFADPDYRRNPVDRCFFCKNNLFVAIARQARGQILTGANRDDLGEYRPGLDAATRHGVRHPFVEAGMGKDDVRRLARQLGLGDEVAALPAGPCLASRIETGIAVEPATLRAVHAAERLVAARTAARTVRCRVRAAGLVMELDEAGLAGLDDTTRAALAAEIAGLFETGLFETAVSFAPYRNGSAFLRPVLGPAP